MHGSGVLMGDQSPRLLDREVGAAPPGVERMAHDQRAQGVGAAGDLVGHDPDPRLEAVVVTAEFPEARDRRVAGAVGIVHRGAVDRLSAAVVDRQPFSDAVGLAVADDHAHDRGSGHPAHHRRVHPHAGQTDLALRAVGMLVGERGQFLLVRAPAHFGGRGALLAEALHAPGVDELIHLLRTVCDLRVALAAVDHLHAQLIGEVVEGPALRVLGDPLRLLAGKLLLLEALGGDVEQRVLREVADESWIGTVLEDGRRAG